MDPVEQKNIFEMALGSGPVVFGVLLILISLSLLSWTVTFAKFMEFRRARRLTEGFRDLLAESRDIEKLHDATRKYDGTPLVALFRAAYRELQRGRGIDSVPLVLRRTEREELERLERGITFLATVASAAPFIGLFGTVWGIMNAFHGLSSATSTTIQAVAPGISEALVATAIGLAAAIPAAVAYNYCVVALKRFRESMDGFGDELVVLIKRQPATTK